jgi:quinol monooxygenase YgiN
MIFHFVESAVPEARAVLERLRTQLVQHPDCLRTELLASTRQVGLYLLMSEWRAEPQLALPAQVKVWTFCTVEPVDNQGAGCIW